MFLKNKNMVKKHLPKYEENKDDILIYMYKKMQTTRFQREILSKQRTEDNFYTVFQNKRDTKVLKIQLELKQISIKRLDRAVRFLQYSLDNKQQKLEILTKYVKNDIDKFLIKTLNDYLNSRANRKMSIIGLLSVIDSKNDINFLEKRINSKLIRRNRAKSVKISNAEILNNSKSELLNYYMKISNSLNSSNNSNLQNVEKFKNSNNSNIEMFEIPEMKKPPINQGPRNNLRSNIKNPELLKSLKNSNVEILNTSIPEKSQNTETLEIRERLNNLFNKWKEKSENKNKTRADFDKETDEKIRNYYKSQKLPYIGIDNKTHYPHEKDYLNF
jgi:hypothetical protein